MTVQKQTYTTPKLTILGNLEHIIQQGGGNQIDVPLGTPVSPDGISGVTGNFS